MKRKLIEHKGSDYCEVTQVIKLLEAEKRGWCKEVEEPWESLLHSTWAFGIARPYANDSALARANYRAIVGLYQHRFGAPCVENGWSIVKFKSMLWGHVSYNLCFSLSKQRLSSLTNLDCKLKIPISPQAQLWLDIQEKLEDYPVVDEWILAEEEKEDQIKNISFITLPKGFDWADHLDTNEKIYDALCELHFCFDEEGFIAFSDTELEELVERKHIVPEED